MRIGVRCHLTEEVRAGGKCRLFDLKAVVCEGGGGAGGRVLDIAMEA